MGLSNKLQSAQGPAPGALSPQSQQQPPPQVSSAAGIYPQTAPGPPMPSGYGQVPYGMPGAQQQQQQLAAPPWGAPGQQQHATTGNPFAAPSAPIPSAGMPSASPWGRPMQQQPQQQVQVFGNPLAPPASGNSSYAQPQQQQQPYYQQQPAGYPQQRPQQQPNFCYLQQPQQQQQQQLVQQQFSPAPAGFAAPGAPQAGGASATAAGPAAAPVAAPGGLAGAILAKLQSIVAVNQLQRFYPAQSLQGLAARLDATVNFRELAARWRMPLELAVDLSSLALYDIIMFCDDSGSMAFEENGERIDDLKLIASKVAEVATLFDQDGILLRFMNSPTEGNGIRSNAEVAALLANVQYTGLTPLASALQSKVLQPIVYHLASQGQLQKPVLIIVITDGEPTDNPRDLVAQVIKDARQRLQQYSPKAVAFQFAQVGKDQRALHFLNSLDTHPEVGGSIDCTSYFEFEAAQYQQKGITLSPEMWLVKMMCGSVDPSYDEADE